MKAVPAFLLGGIAALLFRDQLKGFGKQAIRSAVGAKQKLAEMAAEAMEDLEDSVAEANRGGATPPPSN